MYEFNETKAYNDIIMFVKQVNMNIKNELQSDCTMMKTLFQNINKINDNIELHTTQQRFGNTAFRDFYDKVKEKSKKMITKLGIEINESIIKYLTESFGNKTRIDYGTGHELNFFCFIYCLVQENKIEINQCYSALCYYFETIRKIILKYNLEPAGSHGAWGLDDYQMLPFLFGTSELVDFDVTFDGLLMEVNHEKSPFSEFQFMKCLRFSTKHKCSGRNISFEDHSPILYGMKDKSWNEMNAEILRKFESDVLQNKAMNQHFIFSDILQK